MHIMKLYHINYCRKNMHTNYAYKLQLSKKQNLSYSYKLYQQVLHISYASYWSSALNILRIYASKLCAYIMIFYKWKVARCKINFLMKSSMEWVTPEGMTWLPPVGWLVNCTKVRLINLYFIIHFKLPKKSWIHETRLV
jgi:hypothetical protein